MNIPTLRPTVSRAILLVALLSTIGMAPATAEAADDWTTPRTPWGHPDLQGEYTNTTLTPFERPPALGDKAFFTEDEVAKLEADRAAMIQGAAARPASRTEAGGGIGAYNLHWMELGTKVVGSRRTSLVVDPANGRVPVRQEARAQRQYNLDHHNDSWLHMSIWDRCITRGMPGGMFPAGYNNGYRILQTPDQIVILYEMIHEVRVIPLDGRPHIDGRIRQWLGDSRGHWEGDTLVVESRNFNNKSWIATSGSQGRIKGISQSKDATIVERFTRVDDNTIDWQVTIEDPEIYTTPWTVAIPLQTDRNYTMFEYACHEGNWAVRNTLSGARVLEDLAQSGGE